MFAKRLKRVCLVGMLLTLMACGERQEYKDALVRAEAMMGDRPDSALLILDSLGQYDKAFGRHFRMQYLLHRMNAENKTDVKFTSDSLAKELVDHFDSHGTTNERVLAHYLLGRVYADAGEAPKAVGCYQDAIDAADTTAKDFDFFTLGCVYSQMAFVYRRQLLLTKEIEARKKACDYAFRANQKQWAIYSQAMSAGAYILLNKKDSAEIVLKSALEQFRKYGYTQHALRYSRSLIHLYTESPLRLSEAKTLMDQFEAESDLFDEHHELPPSLRQYYDYKGKYFEGIHQLDSAECYYRKIYRPGMSFTAQNPMYRGLLSVFTKRHQADSIAKYSQLYCMVNDSSIALKDRDAIAQMSALYNYTRSQKEANSMRARADRNKLLFMTALVVLILVLFILEKVRRKQMKTKKENDDLLEENTELEEQKSAAENKLKEVTGKESLTIRKGARLYDQIASNKPVADWLPEDYGAFIGYYEAKHYDSMRQIRKQYGELTNRKMLFVILEDMGKSTDDICRIMSLEKGSLRSLRFRLRNSKE